MGRNFLLFSRVVADGLLTFARRQGAARAFSGRTFSEPVDFSKSVNRFGPLIFQGNFVALDGRVRDEIRVQTKPFSNYRLGTTSLPSICHRNLDAANGPEPTSGRALRYAAATPIGRSGARCRWRSRDEAA